mgnify:CR=1 FL=1
MVGVGVASDSSPFLFLSLSNFLLQDTMDIHTHTFTFPLLPVLQFSFLLSLSLARSLASLLVVRIAGMMVLLGLSFRSHSSSHQEPEKELKARQEATQWKRRRTKSFQEHFEDE